MPTRKSSKGKGGGLTQAAKILGKQGGKKGGPARAEALPAVVRSRIASKGGKAAAAAKGGKVKIHR